MDACMQEGIAVGRSFAMFKNYHIDGNKEMIAFGMMNIAGSCTSCYLTAGNSIILIAIIITPFVSSVKICCIYHSFSDQSVKKCYTSIFSSNIISNFYLYNSLR